MIVVEDTILVLIQCFWSNQFLFVCVQMYARPSLEWDTCPQTNQTEAGEPYILFIWLNYWQLVKLYFKLFSFSIDF